MKIDSEIEERREIAVSVKVSSFNRVQCFSTIEFTSSINNLTLINICIRRAVRNREKDKVNEKKEKVSIINWL